MHLLAEPKFRFGRSTAHTIPCCKQYKNSWSPYLITMAWAQYDSSQTTYDHRNVDGFFRFSTMEYALPSHLSKCLLYFGLFRAFQLLQRDSEDINSVEQSHTRPVNDPVLLANRSVSTPIFWSMLTKTLHSGVLFCELNARCCPCRNPPPARMTGRLELLWILASPIWQP